VSRFRHLFRASIVLIIGTTIGVFVGWLVFSVSTLTGKPLFTVAGGLIGLVVSAIFVAYIRRFDALALSEITLTVPEFVK